MNFQQINDTVSMIRQETFAFCGGSRPTLDEIASFSIILSCFTFNRLPYKTRLRINHSAWSKIVDNTVKKIILENF